jgi:hypothetical protein
MVEKMESLDILCIAQSPSQNKPNHGSLLVNEIGNGSTMRLVGLSKILNPMVEKTLAYGADDGRSDVGLGPDGKK